LIYMLIKLATR